MFITFEGIDGSGKTTVSKNIVQRFTDNPNWDLVYHWTHLPGETEVGRRIREMVLDNKNHKKKLDISPSAELLLYLADRAQCVEKIIYPLLEDLDNVVICDRFDDSTVAYQGGGRELGIDKIREILGVVPPPLVPDITFYLRVPLEVGLERTRKGKHKPDRIESLGVEFYRRVIRAYEYLLERNPKRIIAIDATRSLQKVEDDVIWHWLNWSPGPLQGSSEPL